VAERLQAWLCVKPARKRGKRGGEELEQSDTVGQLEAWTYRQENAKNKKKLGGGRGVRGLSQRSR